jgi:hypothetical protein
MGNVVVNFCAMAVSRVSISPGQWLEGESGTETRNQALCDKSTPKRDCEGYYE